jgi:nitrous oxidase accessory protein
MNRIIMTLLWGLTVACVSAPGRTRTVSAGESLTAAVASVRAGDTLQVMGGVHEGNLTLTKRLVLIGENAPVLRGEGNGSVVTIEADSCVVSGFIVERSGAMLVNEDAGILIKSHANRIENNVLRDVLFGIYLLHAHDNQILNNTIGGRRYLELGERGAGIHVWNSLRNRFIGNRITDARDGFYIQNANHSWIERNECFNVRYGLHYMYADSNTFLFNSFHDNVAGAAIMYSRAITMRHNVFSHNRGFSSFGILFQDCHDLVADSNVISDNVVGMFFEASTDNIFRYNVIAQNDVALQMFQNSINNTFSENIFLDNLSPLAIVGKRTETRWSDRGRGNYWSSYDGYDLDGDGIGDVPMRIQNVFHYLEGQNANVRLYLYSPASQALAAAAKAFPIISISEETDEHPLMTPPDVRDLPAVRNAQRVQREPRSAAGAMWAALPVVGLVALSVLYHRFARRPL